ESADPATAFKQPPGKPSVVSYTIAYLNLMEILRMAQRTIVSDASPNNSLIIVAYIRSTVSGQALR
ncbi:hypothetical protein DFH07DRAFT_753785, partial [Mycena maculata]